MKRKTKIIIIVQIVLLLTIATINHIITGSFSWLMYFGWFIGFMSGASCIRIENNSKEK